MSNWQLLVAAIAAQSLYDTIPGSPVPGADVNVEWDAARVRTNQLLSSGNIRVENNGVNNTINWIPAAKCIPVGAGRIYWEIKIIALGAATNSFSAGIVPESVRDRGDTIALNGALNKAVCFQSTPSAAVIRRGNGNAVSGLTVAVAGDVLMFAYDTRTGLLYYGRNGTWVNDPATNIGTIITAPFENYYPAVAPTDNGDIFEIWSTTSQFAYTLPPSCKAYGADNTNYSYQGLTMSNVFFDNGNNSGWTASASPTVSTLEPSFRTTYEVGTNAFGLSDDGTAANWTNFQRVTFPSFFHTLIDAGEYTLFGGCRAILQNSAQFVKRARISYTFYDVSNTIIGSKINGPWFNVDLTSWTEVVLRQAVPANARSVDFEIENEKISGSAADVIGWSGAYSGLLRIRPAPSVDSHVTQAILGKAVDHVGVRHHVTHAIIVP